MDTATQSFENHSVPAVTHIITSHILMPTLLQGSVPGSNGTPFESVCFNERSSEQHMAVLSYFLFPSLSAKTVGGQSSQLSSTIQCDDVYPQVKDRSEKHLEPATTEPISSSVTPPAQLLEPFTLASEQDGAGDTAFMQTTDLVSEQLTLKHTK